MRASWFKKMPEFIKTNCIMGSIESRSGFKHFFSNSLLLGCPTSQKQNIKSLEDLFKKKFLFQRFSLSILHVRIVEEANLPIEIPLVELYTWKNTYHLLRLSPFCSLIPVWALCCMSFPFSLSFLFCLSSAITI